MKHLTVFLTLIFIGGIVASTGEGYGQTHPSDSVPAPIQNVNDFVFSHTGPLQSIFKPESCQIAQQGESKSTVCRQTLPDGTKLLSETHEEAAFNESKSQTVITTFDPESKKKEKKVVRLKVIYTDADRKVKQGMSYDIVTYPDGGKVIRQILIFKYSAAGKVKKITWTKYDQIGKSQYASLSYHVSLDYDSEGLPLKGRAEHWKDSLKISELFRWDRILDGVSNFDPFAWKQWQDLTQSIVPSEVLPYGF